MTHHDRFVRYNSKHKCKHGNWYDGFDVISRDMTQREIGKRMMTIGSPSHMKMKCSCDFEVYGGIDREVECPRCLEPVEHICEDSFDKKKIGLRCTFCRCKMYFVKDDICTITFIKPEISQTTIGVLRSLRWDEVAVGKSGALGKIVKKHLFISSNALMPCAIDPRENLLIGLKRRKLIINGEKTKLTFRELLRQTRQRDNNEPLKFTSLKEYLSKVPEPHPEPSYMRTSYGSMEPSRSNKTLILSPQAYPFPQPRDRMQLTAKLFEFEQEMKNRFPAYSVAWKAGISCLDESDAEGPHYYPKTFGSERHWLNRPTFNDPHLHGRPRNQWCVDMGDYVRNADDHFAMPHMIDLGDFEKENEQLIAKDTVHTLFKSFYTMDVDEVKKEMFGLDFETIRSYVTNFINKIRDGIVAFAAKVQAKLKEMLESTAVNMAKDTIKNSAFSIFCRMVEWFKEVVSMKHAKSADSNLPTRIHKSTGSHFTRLTCAVVNLRLMI